MTSGQEREREKGREGGGGEREREREREREGETIFRTICIYQRIRGIAEITVAVIRAF